jgi:excisionase family DNA binding protein
MLREEVRLALRELVQFKGNDDSESEIMNIQEVAKKLKMAVPSIYGLVHRRQIPFIKRGKKLIFEQSQVNEWLKTGRRKTVFETDSLADEYLNNEILQNS